MNDSTDGGNAPESKAVVSALKARMLTAGSDPRNALIREYKNVNLGRPGRLAAPFSEMTP